MIKKKTLFLSQDLWELVENGFIELRGADLSNQQKELKEKDMKALLVIQQAVHDSIFPRNVVATKSKEVRTTLKNEYQGSNKVIMVKLQGLRLGF